MSATHKVRRQAPRHRPCPHKEGVVHGRPCRGEVRKYPDGVGWNDRRQQFQTQKGGRAQFNRAMVYRRRKI